MMNLRGIDLNLLVILDALLEEAHVSRAAERLNLSQPATSNALTRARALFEDRLLVRAPGGLRLTPKAGQLRGPLREALVQLGAVVAAEPPALADIRQTVRLVMSDFPAATVFGPLLQRLQAEAPGLNLVLHPWHAGDEIERLRRGEFDLALTIRNPPDADLRIADLGPTGYRIVMRRGHPAAAAFDLERWLAFRHLLVSGSGETRGPIDEVLMRRGLTRRVGAVVPTFLLALQFIADSDLIAALPAATLPPLWQDRLITLDPPIGLPGFNLHLVRHGRSDEDVAVRFVADSILAQINPASGLDGSA